MMLGCPWNRSDCTRWIADWPQDTMAHPSGPSDPMLIVEVGRGRYTTSRCGGASGRSRARPSSSRRPWPRSRPFSVGVTFCCWVPAMPRCNSAPSRRYACCHWEVGVAGPGPGCQRNSEQRAHIDSMFSKFWCWQIVASGPWCDHHEPHTKVTFFKFGFIECGIARKVLQGVLFHFFVVRRPCGGLCLRPSPTPPR